MHIDLVLVGVEQVKGYEGFKEVEQRFYDWRQVHLDQRYQGNDLEGIDTPK